jgi:diguanylate cyclase (GGDEF)-like protein
LVWRTLRSIHRLVFPGGLVVLGLWLLVDRYAPSTAMAQLARIWPWALFAAALGLAFWFHQLRILLAGLAFALAERALDHLSQVGAAPQRSLLEPLVVLLLAVDLAWIGFVRPRGRLSWRSASLALALLAQALLVAVLFSSAGATIREALAGGGSGSGAVPLALGALAAVGGGFAIRASLFGGATSRGLLWATGAAALGVLAGAGDAFSVYFSGCAAILLLTILEASYQMAYEDELTGLPSRRAMNEALLDLGEEYSISLVDIDHFKRINDRHGHDVGDQVLQAVASHLRSVGGGGRAFRYGGEEFALLFAGQRLADVVSHVEALRAEIAGARFTLRGPGRPQRSSKRVEARRGGRRGAGRGLGVTVSAGVAQPSPRRPDAAAVLKAADQALYRAKRGGRNQVRR